MNQYARVSCLFGIFWTLLGVSAAFGDPGAADMLFAFAGGAFAIAAFAEAFGAYVFGPRP